MKNKSRILRAAAALPLIFSVAASAADDAWDGSTAPFSEVRWNAGSGVVAWPGIGNNAIIGAGLMTVGATRDVDSVSLTGGGLDIPVGGFFNRAFARAQ